MREKVGLSLRTMSGRPFRCLVDQIPFAACLQKCGRFFFCENLVCSPKVAVCRGPLIFIPSFHIFVHGLIPLCYTKPTLPGRLWSFTEMHSNESLYKFSGFRKRVTLQVFRMTWNVSGFSQDDSASCQEALALCNTTELGHERRYETKV